MTVILTTFSIGQRLSKDCCTRMMQFFLNDKLNKLYSAKMTDIRTKFLTGQRLPKECCIEMLQFLLKDK